MSNNTATLLFVGISFAILIVILIWGFNEDWKESEKELDDLFDEFIKDNTHKKK